MGYSLNIQTLLYALQVDQNAEEKQKDLEELQRNTEATKDLSNAMAAFIPGLKQLTEVKNDPEIAFKAIDNKLNQIVDGWALIFEGLSKTATHYSERGGTFGNDTPSLLKELAEKARQARLKKAK